MFMIVKELPVVTGARVTRVSRCLIISWWWMFTKEEQKEAELRRQGVTRFRQGVANTRLTESKPGVTVNLTDIFKEMISWITLTGYKEISKFPFFTTLIEETLDLQIKLSMQHFLSG